jgi:hypothetical protein
MDLSLGRYLAHPADPRTEPLPDYAVEQATDHALGIPTHWLTFLAASIGKYDCADIESWSIKLEDIRDCDTATLLVLAITGTNEQAAAARLYLQEAFCEHHSELINQLATECDDAHNDGPDEWEAA